MSSKPIRTPILVDGNEWAVLVDHGDSSSQVLWKVAGPCDVENARRLAIAVLEMTGGVPGGEMAAALPPAGEARKPRSVTAAIREHFAAGMSDDEVWLAVKEEFTLSNDKRYRVKEVKKEMINAGMIQVIDDLDRHE